CWMNGSARNNEQEEFEQFPDRAVDVGRPGGKGHVADKTYHPVAQLFLASTQTSAVANWDAALRLYSKCESYDQSSNGSAEILTLYGGIHLQCQPKYQRRLQQLHPGH
ncbi:MAG: hypothetical protein M1816_004915, partial [Peltula sp. TS41687]